MINTLRMSFKIDFTYAINSFTFNLKRMPIIKNIIKDNIYSKSGFKTFIRILAIICTSLKLIVFKLFYIGIIYFISKNYRPYDISSNFIHLFFIFSIIGMFINTNILGTGKKKYLGVLLFKMDAKEFILSHFIFSSIITFILNSVILLFFCIFLKIPLFMSLILSLFSLTSKLIGESLNINYYKKSGIRLIDDHFIYFSVIIIGLLLSFLLPFFNIYFNNNVIILLTIISSVISIFCYYYINKIKDYRLMYKKLNTHSIVMNSDLSTEYSKQAIINIRDKDKLINNKKLEGKKGYDLFNTIFFERHKYILLRSSNIYSIISFVLFIVTMIIIYEVPSTKDSINVFLMNKLGCFVIIMYFMNRGAIVTRAMYFNCDHSMLTFNFYRNKNVILELFKKRLLTLIKINVRPALVLSFSLPIILFFSGGAKYVFDYLNIFVFIIAMSVFFSVHYLVIYYLLQPYNKEMQMKSVTYSLISFLTYYFSYLCINLKISTLLFSSLAILFTIIYIVIALLIVYKRAYKTFKIK